MTDQTATNDKKKIIPMPEEEIDFTKYRKINDETLSKLGEAFSAGATVQQACSHALITTPTYYNFKKDYPDHADALESRKNDLAMAAKFRLKTAIMTRETSGDLALKTLERIEKDTFAQRIEQKNDGVGPTVPQINISVAPMFPDTKRKELEGEEIIDVPVQIKENTPETENNDGGVIEKSGIKIS